MKVLMRSDVSGVGKKGDLVEVADGFARNYLVPKGWAIQATKGIDSQGSAMRRSRDLRDAADRGAAEEIAKVLVPAVISLSGRAADEEKLFGSISVSELISAVKDQTGIELDRKSIHLEEPLKTLGTHSVPAKLHSDVQFAITVEISAS